eukprot:CAMPEP_0116882398 /NCGR_PEP_ID=MMETSP0463-20121206/14615_1 /TAXON_ID=181622 /ORGANISM="Strombidinopsis sp, Strain SopsisLIS2011" /LENGTH=73 /DNA_ID=CAMNT_0004535513 /DNA_START=794 /DNA_END=1015 /DNA_ORIENTATION=-
MRKSFVLILGLCLLALGMFLVGTSEIFGFNNDSLMILVGLCVVGLAMGMMTIPALPEVLDAISQDESNNYDSE